MKSESLLSARSNLSQLSNVSYHGEKKQYIGSQFFKESLPPGHNQKFMPTQLKQQQIGLDSLGVGVYRNFTPIKEYVSAFTPFWTSQLHHIQGTSDNENEPENPQIKQQIQQQIKVEPEIKFEYKQSQKIKQQFEGISEQEFSSQSDKMISKQSPYESEKVLKNETKNIPKNYGKAIIIFIENNRELIENVLLANGDNYDRLLLKLRALKKKINTISDLRNLWENQEESKSLRTISNNFLRKHSLHYIYNSRIKTRLCHAKYKRRLQQAILNPQEFNHIKDY